MIPMGYFYKNFIFYKCGIIETGKESDRKVDQRIKEIIDNFEKMLIGVDEPFKFRCTMCGKCCIHRDDILLNPKDVYNMSKELGMSPQEMIEQYCEIYIGDDSRMPIVRLKPRGTVQRCPLLKDRKCMVHKAKPAVCAMYPIGRCLKAGEADLKNITEDDILYIFQNPRCGDDKETHTVREWLESFGIPLEDEFFIRWQKVAIELCSIFRKAEKKLKPETMVMVWSAAFAALYLRYKTENDFMPQFEENAGKLLELIHTNFGDGTKA